MEHILLLTDFSEDSLHAARYTIQLFGMERTRYTAVHAYMDAYMADPLLPLPTLGSGRLDVAEQSVRDWVARVQGLTGIPTMDHHLGIGGPAQVSNGLATESHADLVVVGRSGKGGSGLFGSTAVDLMKRGHVPVLVVPRTTALTVPGTILLADDHDEVGPQDLAMLRTIASRAKAKVIIAHVEMEVAEGSAHWSNGIYELALKGIEHTFMPAHGTDVVDGLNRLVRKEHAHMVALLHRHLDLISSLLHPSTTKELVLHGDLPVLVLEQRRS